FERRTPEITPTRRQQQRPWPLARPARQFGIGDKAPGFPSLHHRGEHFTRIAIEINEARLREDLRQKWNPKRILRRLFEHANAARWRRRTVPIAQQLIKAIAQCGDDFRTRVTFAETVRVEVRGENAKASHAFDDAVALTANSV